MHEKNYLPGKTDTNLTAEITTKGMKDQRKENHERTE